MEPEVEAPERARGLVSLAQPRYCQGGVEVADDEVVEAVVVLDVSAEVGEEVVSAVVVLEVIGAEVDNAADDVEDEAEDEVKLAVEVVFNLLFNWYICNRLPAPQ
jgi:hypothetical protein